MKGELFITPKFLKEIYEGHSIYEFTNCFTRVYYKIITPDYKYLDFYFDTVEEAKTHIDSLIYSKN